MNYGLLTWLVIAALFVAAILTLMIFKEEERKMKKYEEEGDTAEGELERSIKYEKTSLTLNIRNLTWIYVIVIIGSIVALGVYFL
ncbi:hypothetical protein GCM10010978_33050 [Compostibacillus humi]|uniref:Uncharacterized protein n=1 Tax=Compostibacillus humi TaxID=1245525 RepID=A0A8J2TU37_9BACI|nr:hypothetical protein [Compostibacillus humi]GFZ92170.1 hypothetical protein GCM10010978_33050 [Compostibacillus humi]